MMRYVPMIDVVNQGEHRFAFWDTVRDRFVEIAGDQSWCSIEELEDSFAFAYTQGHGLDLRERLVGLARGSGALEESPPEMS